MADLSSSSSTPASSSSSSSPSASKSTFGPRRQRERGRCARWRKSVRRSRRSSELSDRMVRDGAYCLGRRRAKVRGAAMTAYTIGHSTHPLSRLVELLRGAGVTCLADVRTVPRSRRVPQFNREALVAELPGAGLDYLHVPELGGWR